MPDAPPVEAVMQQDAAVAIRAEELIEQAQRKLSVVENEVCVPSTGPVIVVCAPKEPPPYQGPVFEQEPPIMDRLGQALTTHVGPAETGPMAGPDWIGYGVRIKF